MPEIRKLDSKGIDALIFEEGMRLSPYSDSKGIPTIGIGMTWYPETGKRVKLTDPPLKSKAEAIRQFGLIVLPYEKGVWSVTRDDITQNEFNALTLICYNIGVTNFKNSTLLSVVNENPKYYARIEKAFLMWRFSGGKPILLERRKREFKLYKATM